MDEQWKKQLRREASTHHMCAENREALGSVESKRDAIALYKKTVDWALEVGYPSLDTLRRDFSDCEEDGIFIDKHFDGDVLTEQQVYVFHHCSGTVRVGLNVQKRIIPMLYFANDCDITIKGIPGTSLRPRVPLYIFGQNRITAEQSKDIICKVFNFETR